MIQKPNGNWTKLIKNIDFNFNEIVFTAGDRDVILSICPFLYQYLVPSLNALSEWILLTRGILEAAHFWNKTVNYTLSVVFVVVYMYDILVMLAKIPCNFNVSVNLSPYSGLYSPSGYIGTMKKNCGILHHREYVLIACFLKIKLIIHVNESGLRRQFQTPLNSSKLPVDEILQITKNAMT